MYYNVSERHYKSITIMRNSHQNNEHSYNGSRYNIEWRDLNNAQIIEYESLIDLFINHTINNSQFVRLRTMLYSQNISLGDISRINVNNRRLQ